MQKNPPRKSAVFIRQLTATAVCATVAVLVFFLLYDNMEANEPAKHNLWREANVGGNIGSYTSYMQKKISTVLNLFFKRDVEREEENE